MTYKLFKTQLGGEQKGALHCIQLGSEDTGTQSLGTGLRVVSSHGDQRADSLGQYGTLTWSR